MASEKRLIDANFLVNKMIPNCPIEDGGIPLKDFHTHQKILALYPTVDAVEVVHGRWVYEPVEFTYEKDIKCSVCSAYVDHATNYCPHCGSKMEGYTQ